MRAEDRYDSLFQFYAEKSGVDWLLLKAQVKQESAFDPDARSRVGALGLAQFMERTWEEWKDGTAGIEDVPPRMNPVLLDPRDPEDMIRAQAAYMAWLLNYFAGELNKALAAYNWGIGNVRKALVTYGQGAWKAALPEETQGYLAKIGTYYERYRKEATNALKAV